MEKNTLESALKEFSQTSGTNANDVKEFFALMNDGSIKRMPKEDMATVLGGLIGVSNTNKNGLLPSYRTLTTNTNLTKIKVATITKGGVAIFKVCSLNTYSAPFMGYIVFQDNNSGNKNLFFVKLFDTGTYIDKVKVSRIDNADKSSTIYVESPAVPIAIEAEELQVDRVTIHYESSEIPSNTIVAVEKTLYGL